ncbi:MAG: hypothetical protein ABNH53_04230 [Henriciella sp.]|jgi:hypothetical protein
MIRGLPASIIAHAAVLGMTYVSLPYFGTRIYVEPVQAVAVEFAELGEINNIAPTIEPQEEEAVAEEIPEEEVPEEEIDDVLPEAEEDVSDSAEPESAPEDPEDVLPDFTEEKPDDPEEKPEPKLEPKLTPKPPVDPLADFLNQSESRFKSEIETQKKKPDPIPTPVADKPKTALKNAPKPTETKNRRGAGERNANIARVDSILYGRIFPCWDGVSDLPYPDKLNVRMSLKLRRNGQIEDLRLVEPSRRPLGNSPMGTAVDRALRAVRKCAPYNLPDEDYEIWREGAVNLGPAFTPTNNR